MIVAKYYIFFVSSLLIRIFYRVVPGFSSDQQVPISVRDEKKRQIGARGRGRRTAHVAALCASFGVSHRSLIRYILRPNIVRAMASRCFLAQPAIPGKRVDASRGLSLRHRLLQRTGRRTDPAGRARFHRASGRECPRREAAPRGRLRQPRSRICNGRSQ